MLKWQLLNKSLSVFVIEADDLGKMDYFFYNSP